MSSSYASTTSAAPPVGQQHSFPQLSRHDEELLNASLNVDFAKVFEDEFNDSSANGSGDNVAIGGNAMGMIQMQQQAAQQRQQQQQQQPIQHQQQQSQQQMQQQQQLEQQHQQLQQSFVDCYNQTGYGMDNNSSNSNNNNCVDNIFPVPLAPSQQSQATNIYNSQDHIQQQHLQQQQQQQQGQQQPMTCHSSNINNQAQQQQQQPLVNVMLILDPTTNRFVYPTPAQMLSMNIGGSLAQQQQQQQQQQLVQATNGGTGGDINTYFQCNGSGGFALDQLAQLRGSSVGGNNSNNSVLGNNNSNSNNNMNAFSYPGQHHFMSSTQQYVFPSEATVVSNASSSTSGSNTASSSDCDNSSYRSNSSKTYTSSSQQVQQQQVQQQGNPGQYHCLPPLAPMTPAMGMMQAFALQQQQQEQAAAQYGSSGHNSMILPSGSVASGQMSVMSGASSTVTSNTTATAELPPLRSLSAYNFFFRDERDRILHGGEHDWSSDKQKKLLQDHWQRDRTKKRRHRKTHGKIDFTTLSKLISQRWKELEESKKAFYRQVAAQDWERYQRELNEYKMNDANKVAAAQGQLAAAQGQLAASQVQPVMPASFAGILG